MASMFSRSVSRSLAATLRRQAATRVALAPCTAIRARIAALTGRRVSVYAAQRAHFSTGDDAVSSVAAAIDENRFLELAEGALEDIQFWIDGIEEMLEESDVSLSQGVLKIDLAEYGTWVLNRQIPNRQIWWSSPISGPRRYEYDTESGKWLSTRDKTELMERLQEEIAEATGIEIFQ